MNPRFNSCFCCLFLTIAGQQLAAGDWPQILGPNRDGLAAKDERLADSWPKDGPAVLWQRKVGGGFAGLAVVQETAVLFHRVDDDEVVESLDVTTGKPRWTSKSPTSFSSGFSDDQGPRCTPLIHGDRVVVLGVQGLLRCLELKSGNKIWERATHAEFKAPEGYFGAGSSPIVVGDKVLVNVGAGKTGAGIVAFALATGKTLWKAVNDDASYSSPVTTTVDGVQHVIFVTRSKTVSLDPETGKVRFEFPFGKRGPTVNGATPVVLNGHLLVSAHYGVGAVFAKIGATSADEVWNSDDIFSSQYMTPLTHYGLVYGIHGQERVSEPDLRCFDAKTQKVLWSKPDFAFGTMLQADGKFVTLTTDGELILWKPDAKRYQELARTQLFRSTTRALPALSNGRLFVRDSSTLKCVQLGSTK
ncbi:MAG: PQQ-like beta-propeller repeat protein [Planctomycetia bacterium]|nr:PQQ-like beta-propeller repeat protein [Planctomycetia bacterium]